MSRRAALLPAVLAVGALSLGSCGDGASQGAPTASAPAPGGAPSALAPASSASAAAATSAAAPAPSASAVAAGALPGRTDGCPDGMVRVEGDYCPDVEQTCAEHHEEFERDRAKSRKAKAEGASRKSTVSERCLRYEPSRCLSKERVRKSFCVDRYEFPNEKGKLPALLVSWTDAKKACEAAGKRLCTEAEFNFACEGEEMWPYTYGFSRDATKCSIDKEYRKREKKLYPYERCMRTPACKEHLEHLDQRLPAGSMEGCVSPFGVFDMNGNINEWVELPGKKYPDRSGLKGGWWGPVRNRCRPTVGFHKEDDYGYEAGFRCCKDAEAG